MAVIGSVLPDILFGGFLNSGLTSKDIHVDCFSDDGITVDAEDGVISEPDLCDLKPLDAIYAADPELLYGLTAIERLTDEEAWQNHVIEFVYETRELSNGDDDDNSVCLTPEDLADLCDDDLSSLDSSHSNSDWDRLEDSNSDSSSVNGDVLPDLSRLIDGAKSVGKPVSLSDKETYHSKSSEQRDEHIPCKGKRGAKNILLWKFLLHMLDTRQDLVQWVDLQQGTFKFVDTQSISKIWGGEKKKSSRMNFEKLSRGIRHYYKTGLMSRISGQRLIYKFNWEKVPKKYRKC